MYIKFKTTTSDEVFIFQFCILTMALWVPPLHWHWLLLMEIEWKTHNHWKERQKICNISVYIQTVCFDTESFCNDIITVCVQGFTKYKQWSGVLHRSKGYDVSGREKRVHGRIGESVEGGRCEWGRGDGGGWWWKR